ncbi:hypothetical protein QWZ03_17870 [Chitinimonas viridis]|uniref:Uncharacterized protein n=1 Tax=Chitinimonas viridis TaxID=664880 RepID=A0ABT8BAY9_9NEIS|nr:hypothetical protein [Chitinimonas viridis]MDN3578639.1 hypothetical protein [Chitinimonas viridis]
MRHLPSLLAALLLSPLLHAADQPAAAPVQLPPAWARGVPVSTLIGADVAAGLSGQATPAQFILKVTDLARLPQPVQGASECVFEAEGWANLSSERITVQPRLLRCFDGQGREIASRPVRGFAADKDARNGIKAPLLWGQAAKDLLLMGVGAQAKQNFLQRAAKSALGRASLGLTDDLMGGDKAPRVEGDAVREVRSSETLLPMLALEPGREFNIVLGGTPQ